MATESLTGSDTISIDGVPLVDLGDGDVGALTYPNELVGVKTGKNGNSIFALNETGDQADLVIRVLRASPDDKTLNSRLATMKADFASFSTLTGQVIKKVGDGQGNVSNDIYDLSGGVFSKRVEAKSNVEGDTEQSLAIYSIKFTNSPRSIS
jgi:hypothetical protein